MKQCISSDEAKPATKQHRRPCSDCPFSRKSLNGWLGDTSIDQWLADAHGETKIDCHVHLGVQCAGAAIYRGNVFKRPRSLSILQLPMDQKTVFASQKQFREHHEKRIIK